MNISKFLLIDAVLVIAAIPLLFLLTGGKKTPLIRSSSKEELLRESPYKLPDKEKLIELEKLAINQGSGIESDSIIGNWKFISIWKKEFI